MFKYVEWATLAERSKVSLDLWTLFIDTRLNISSQNNDFGFHSIKNNFSKYFPFKCIKANLTLTLSRSRSSWFHHLNKLGRPQIPNATYKVSRSLAFWFWRRKFLKGFYHIRPWRLSLSCDQNILYKFWLTYHKESSHEIWVQLGQSFVRKLCFNILMGPQYEWPWLKGQRSTLTFETYL